MPNIREYDNKENIKPSSAGADALAQGSYYAGRSMQNMGDTIGSAISSFGQAYEQHEAQSEIGKTAKESTQLLDQKSAEWDNLAKTTDPNDISILQKFREQSLEPALEDLVNNAQTEKGKVYAQDQADRIRQHLFQTTASDMSTRAGDALVTNYNTVTASASNIARRNPSGMDNIIEMYKPTISELVDNTPRLSSGAAAKAKTELTQKGVKGIVTGAIQGMAEQNAVEAEKFLNSGKADKYLDAAEIQTLHNEITAHQRAQLEAKRAAETEQRRQEKESVERASLDVMKKYVTTQPDGTQHVAPEAFGAALALGNLKGADHAQVTAAYNALKAIHEDEVNHTMTATDGRLYDDFAHRMWLGENDPRQLSRVEIDQAQADHKISGKDADFFRSSAEAALKDPSLVEDRRQFNDFMDKYAKGYITKSTMFGVDAQGDQKFYEYERDKWLEFRAARQTGKSRDELLTPANPSFIGKDVSKYQLSGDRQIENMQTKATNNLQPLPPTMGGSAAYQPGESMSDYAKRLQGGK